MAFSKSNKESGAVKKDALIFDYLKKIESRIGEFDAMFLYISKLQNQSLRSSRRQALFETFEIVVRKNGGEMFALPNEDIVIIFNRSAYDAVKACLVKIRFVLHDDPLIKSSVDLMGSDFVKLYELSTEQETFRGIIREAVKNAPATDDEEHVVSAQPAAFGGQGRKVRRPLTPLLLAKMRRALAMMDFSSLIRRQSVCAVIGKAPPQMIFDEVFVSIADLRDMIMPDVDLVSNPWLFQYLTETLDKRVLVNVSRHDDGSLTSNFSLNLNVSTILSDEFLEFDENINPVQRSTIVLELQLTDIFSDIKAFILAKTFAQYRGYKICIDGITVDKLKYIDREQIDGDLIKIIWHPTFMDVINEDKHFTDYVNKAERARMILCRVDDPKAVEVGNSLGINLYQGRYIQRMLAAQTRRTIYNIKK